MELQITRTTPIYRHPETTGVFLQWTVEGVTSADLIFKIERSGSPEGPFEDVIDNITTFHFFDALRHVPVPEPTVPETDHCSGIPDEPTVETRENLNFLSLHRQVYYKVTATHPDGEVSHIRPLGDELPRRQFLLRRKIQRDIRVGFKFNSVPLVILKRRHWGLRCEVCFDKLTKQVTKSKCEECYGTGFKGGYFDPVRVNGRIGVDNIQTQIAQHGKVDVNQKQLTMLDYPILEEADIIAELRQNNRYIVKTITQTELRTVTVHQRAIISELERDSIEYRLVINADHIPVIY